MNGSFLLVFGLLATSPQDPPEPLLDLDLKEADIASVVRLFAEVGELNMILDPDVSCAVTVKMSSVRWPEAFRALLATCGLDQERIGENIVRVATRAAIRQELEERRRYEEEKSLSGPLTTSYRKLSYARAREVAPRIEQMLSPRGSVVFDERTNLLIIRDVAPRRGR